MKVVDASVAVKWLVPEAGSLTAQALLAGLEKLAAPALIRVEVAAAVTRKVRLNELTEAEARTACELWSSALVRGVVTLSRDEDDLPGRDYARASDPASAARLFIFSSGGAPGRNADYSRSEIRRKSKGGVRACRAAGELAVALSPVVESGSLDHRRADARLV